MYVFQTFYDMYLNDRLDSRGENFKVPLEKYLWQNKSLFFCHILNVIWLSAIELSEF